MPRRTLWLLVILFLQALPAGGTAGGALTAATSFAAVPTYGYTLIDSFPHDPNAFTQGLVYRNGYLYESTGLYGGSSLRKVVLETGEVVKRRNLSSVYFGEGLTIYQDTLYQLTWLEHVGFVYVELEEFELVETFAYDTPGWGLTHDDTGLIMSDGTDKLYYLDPETYEEVGRVHVTAEGSPVTSLNELELIRGRIYANILNSDLIAVIEPSSGEVEAWVDLSGILAGSPPGPLNGIAFDPDSVRLFVTGKRWPALFEIWTDPLDYAPQIVDWSPPSPVCAFIDSPLVFSVVAEDLDPGDSLEYFWSINGVVDESAGDSSFEYASSVSTTDTVLARVTDGTFSDSTTWIVYVEIAGVDYPVPRDEDAHDALTHCRIYPNPLVRSTTVGFTIPPTPGSGLPVCVTIHDVSGRRVRTLARGDFPPGRHRCIWDGKDSEGRRVPPGVFFCLLRLEEERTHRRIAVLE